MVFNNYLTIATSAGKKPNVKIAAVRAKL